MIFAQIWMNWIGEDVAKKNVCIISIVHKHTYNYTYLSTIYVRIYNGWRYSEFTVDNSWNALIKKKTTRALRVVVRTHQQSQAPPQAAHPIVTGTCCLTWLMLGESFSKWHRGILDVSLILSLNMWYGKSASLKTMLLNNDTFGSSMTYAYEFNIFQKTHPCRSTMLASFKDSHTSYITPHFNLAMNAKLPQHQHISHFFLPNWENVRQAGQLVRPGSRLPM